MLLMNSTKNASRNMDKSPEGLIDEVLKMDRLLYLMTIQGKKSMTSLKMTREVLALKNNLKPEQVDHKKVARNNPNINKRLKDMADLGILNDRGGEYSLSLIGSLIIDELTRLFSNIEVLRKYKWFFDTHDYAVIPSQQIREIYKIQFARQCEDTIEYQREIENNTLRTNYGIRIATEHLHDIPNWIMEELKLGNLNLKLIYHFKEPFKLNYNDENEQKLWRDLTQEALPGVELRYLILTDRNPIGIRIIDEKWAIFSLFEIYEKRLNRPRSFYGTHNLFINWIEDVFSNIWNSSKSLKCSNLWNVSYD